MDPSPSPLTDVDAFSSFFIDYKPPNPFDHMYSLNPSMLSLKPHPFSTPSDTSSSSASTSTQSLIPTTSIPTRLTSAQATRTLVLKRKLFDNNPDEMKAAIAAITLEDRIQLADLENFANYFKRRRNLFGFTQGDVGAALGKKYGTEFSQTTISRFEALNLSFKNMLKLRPLLKDWIEQAEIALSQGVSLNEFLKKTPPDGSNEMDTKLALIPANSSSNKKKTPKFVGRRKRRTFIDDQQSDVLAIEYEINSHPSSEDYSKIADKLNLDKDTVRIWFSNHRQKIRKIEDVTMAMMLQKEEGTQWNVKKETKKAKIEEEKEQC